MNVVILDTGCANLSSVKSAVRATVTPRWSAAKRKSYYALTNSFCPASARHRPLWINCANVN
ncbi:imidazole glycerol phosphate synthase subunit HisH [Salmonella enterica subsp. enterica]|nr:imidazole glycerol phosphate synthase subunit HisH [Salmonella enterica subsp. enterica]